VRRAVGVAAAALLLAGCVQVQWQQVSDWNRFSVVNVSHATNGVTLTVGAPGDKTGRITETGTELNDRRWWVLNGSSALASDGELLTLWRGHTRWRDGGGQRGQVLRAQRMPNGTTAGYVAWHDYVFGQDHIVHAAVWFTDDGQNFRYAYLGGAAFDFMKNTTLDVNASRTSNVVTLTVPPAHGVEAGDTLIVDTVDAGFDGVATISAVSPTSVTYSDPGPDTVLGGPGTAQNLDGVAPYWVRTQIVGRTFAVKVWPDGQPEPPWTDPVHVRVFEDSNRVGPAGPGRAGILAGHIDRGASVAYGPVEFSSLDGQGPAPLDPTRPTAADVAAMRTVTGGSGLPVVAAGSVP
jgi:hypothetical protein